MTAALLTIAAAMLVIVGVTLYTTRTRWEPVTDPYRIRAKDYLKIKQVSLVLIHAEGPVLEAEIHDIVVEDVEFMRQVTFARARLADEVEAGTITIMRRVQR